MLADRGWSDTNGDGVVDKEGQPLALSLAGGEAHALLERQHTGGDEGGDLPERVPGERDRDLGKRLHRLPHDERRQEHRELCFAGAGQIVGSGFGDEEPDLLAEGGLCVVDHVPRGVVTPGRRHTGLLGSLTGEDDRDAHRAPDALTADCGLVPTGCAVTSL